MRITRALFLLVAAAIAGCSDSPNEPETVGISGSFTFGYTGAGATGSAQFNATGAIPSNYGVNNGTQPWAAGTVNATNNQTIVYGFIPKGTNAWDWSYITIDRTTAGTATIGSSCSTNCADMGIWVGMNQNGTNYSYICTLTTGTVNVTAITSTTATGTFSGSGTCFASGTSTETPFTVTNGSFNVGLTTLID